MNFSNFCSNNQNIENLQKNNENLQKNCKINQKNDTKIENIDEEVKKDMEQKLEKYKNLNQNQLTEELLKEANKQKMNGNLNDEKIKEIQNTILPMLDESQKNKFNELINLIK